MIRDLVELSPNLRFWTSLQQNWLTASVKVKGSHLWRGLRPNRLAMSCQMRSRRRHVDLVLVTDLKHPHRDTILEAQSQELTLSHLTLRLERKEVLTSQKQACTHLVSGDSTTRRYTCHSENRILTNQFLALELMMLNATQFSTMMEESLICRVELRIHRSPSLSTSGRIFLAQDTTVKALKSTNMGSTVYRRLRTQELLLGVQAKRDSSTTWDIKEPFQAQETTPQVTY